MTYSTTANATRKALLLGTVIFAAAALHGAHAQGVSERPTAPAAPSTKSITVPGQHVAVPDLPKAPASRDNFRKSLEEFGGQLDGLLKEAQGVGEQLRKQGEANVDQRKVEIDALRQKLITLGASLEPGGPLSQNLDRFQSWIGAQLGRINGQRQNFGNEFVEDLIARYQTYQREASESREQLVNRAKAIDALLRDLTVSEMKISELLLAEDASAVMAELRNLVMGITKTIDAMNKRIKAQIGAPAS
jgi:proline-rich tail region repeat protein